MIRAQRSETAGKPPAERVPETAGGRRSAERDRHEAPFALLRRKLLLAFASLSLCGCAHATTIAHIVDHPKSYADKTVVVEGKVETAFSLLLVKYFSISDGSGSIGVLTTQALPRKGEWVRVIGKVHPIVSFGSDSLLVMIEEAQDAAPSLYTLRERPARGLGAGTSAPPG